MSDTTSPKPRVRLWASATISPATLVIVVCALGTSAGLVLLGLLTT